MPVYLPPDYFSQQSAASRVLDSGDFRPRIGPGFTTPDLEQLHAHTLRSQLAHAAFIQSQQAQDNLDNRLLQTASPYELSNMFGTPRNDREARLQQIVQEDLNAKERGAQLIPTWRTLQAYHKGNLENQHLANQIADEQLNRQYVPKEFALKQRASDLNQSQFANTKDYQGKELSQKDRQFALSQQIERDRLNQQSTAANRADQRATYEQFANMQKAVQNGELSADDLIAAMPGLSTAQQTILRAHEQNARANADQAAAAAAAYNDRLKRSIPQPVAATPHWYGSSGGYTPSEEEKAAAIQREMDKFQHDAIARKQIFYDDKTGTFQPLLRFGASTASGNSGYADPVPPELRGNRPAYLGGMTGAMDIPSGAFPSETARPAYLDVPSAGAQYAPAAAPADSGAPTTLRNGTYRAPDGSQYRVVNGRRYRS